MIPLSRLYAYTGGLMALLLAAMLIDAHIPPIASVWIDALAHPFIALTAIMLILALLYERERDEASIALFTGACVLLLVAIINESLVSMSGAGTIPLAASVLASLSVRMTFGWYFVAISGAAAVLNGSIFLSSLLVATIIGAGISLLFTRWHDA